MKVRFESENKKVGVAVWGIDQKFKNGKKSKNFKVFDTTPDEVLEVIEQALISASNKK